MLDLLVITNLLINNTNIINKFSSIVLTGFSVVRLNAFKTKSKSNKANSIFDRLLMLKSVNQAL